MENYRAIARIGILRHSTLAEHMDLRCQHCGERIVARGFGKCPGCYRELPEDLQLSPKEKELEEMEEAWREKEERNWKNNG